MTPRPCVCGGTPAITPSHYAPDYWHVHCGRCGAHHQNYGRERAIADWNRDMERNLGMPLWQWRAYVRLCNDR